MHLSQDKKMNDVKYRMAEVCHLIENGKYLVIKLIQLILKII